MDQRSIKKLERELEAAIANTMQNMGLNQIPLFPSRQTLHLMSKAAVTVYETAVENQQPKE